MNTYSVKAKDINRSWHLIDAEGQILGKVATEAASYLMGKHKTMVSRHMDTGDNVLIINAAKVLVTGNKAEDKIYYSNRSNYLSGLKEATFNQMMDKNPIFAVQHAVRGMLPRTRLGEAMMSKLRVYPDSEHPHGAQIKKTELKGNTEGDN